ncbi:MAG: SLBB domain-containing protein [Sandaracinaceae bacterium]|nr:SLBB domain-containing protein [Sandaracinaceae bacterium]
MHRLPSVSLVALATAWLALPGCGASLPRAPQYPSADEGFRAADATPPGLDSDPASPLSLYPGDRVALRMESATVSTVEGLSVDERGILHVPLVGDVDVSGLPLTEAERRIETGMHPFDATVRITVLLSEPLGHQASVVGAVGDQGRIPVTSGMRVADLLAAAGGPVQADNGAFIADLDLARLVRGGQAVPISVRIALTGDPRHNVRIRPGDHLYVPPQRAGLISVIGEVNGARVFPYQEGIRLSQALAMAGGATRDANGGDIRIVRGPSDHPMVYRAAIDHIVAGEHADPILAPGDIVHVGSSALADFRDVMSAAAPVISLGATAAVGVVAALPQATATATTP